MKFARAIIVVLLMPLILAFGIYLGGHPRVLPDPVRDVLVKDDQAQLYDEALEIIEDDYYRKVDRDQLFDNGLEAAVKSLDDQFSFYFDPKTYKAFAESTSGAFEGVGMSVEAVPKGLKVLEVYDGSPAKRGGIRKGDTIVAVNGRSIAGNSSDESTTRIKGPAGTSVRLTWVRGKNRITRQVKRARVDLPVVEARMERSGGKKIAYVSLAGFSTGAHGELRQRIRELLKKGADRVLLDLRGNGGGLLNEAVLVSSIFLPDGTIVSTKGRSRPEQVYKAAGKSIDTDIPVAVLVDNGSASASEIVAGALQDRDRATVIGTETFGKGVFQEVKELSNGGALDITVGEFFTPKGRNLGGGGVKRGAGIKPDVTARDIQKTENEDEGLEKALRVLAKARGGKA